jgi:hypothetical protein
MTLALDVTTRLGLLVVVVGRLVVVATSGVGVTDLRERERERNGA